jgi:hypothetical protein
MIQTSLLDLINETRQADDHRHLQNELPRELAGWELFLQRLGGRKSYFCINFSNNIITARHPTSRRAIEEAFTYAVIYELLPLPSLEKLHPKRWLPAHWRELIIAHERRLARGQITPHPRPDQPIQR